MNRFSYDRLTIGGRPSIRVTFHPRGTLAKLFPTPNGIRVVHGDARLRDMDLQHISGRRWRTATTEHTRVRVCRGSRR